MNARCPELIDTHCHLNFEPLSNDVAAVLRRAVETDVRAVIVPAFDRKSWDDLEKLRSLPGVSVALGLHPWKADEDFDREILRRRIEAAGAVVDRFGRPRPMMIKLIFWKRSGKNHWSPRSIDFDTCGIEVERLTVEDGRLVFSGRFECLSGKAGAAGRFDVEGGELGVFKVD